MHARRSFALVLLATFASVWSGGGSLLYGQSSASPRRVASPFTLLAPSSTGTEAPWSTMALAANSHELFRELHQADQGFVLTGLALDGEELVELWLRPIRVMEPGSTAVVVDADGERFVAPSVSLFSGHVPGRASAAFLAVSENTVNGYVSLAGELTFLSTGGPSASGLVTAAKATSWGGTLPSSFQCVLAASSSYSWPQAPYAAPKDQPFLRTGEVFIEGDNKFRQLFPDDQSAIDYAVTLVAATSEIYRRDLGVVLTIPTNWLRIWNVQAPWGPVNTFTDVINVATWWSSAANPDKDLVRAAVHVFTEPIFGGAAMDAGGVCSNLLGYEVSSLAGSFPTPIQHTDPNNWDLLVVSHEFGHTFGSLHTFDYLPPIPCVDGSGPDAGTIMSYCHTNPGGVSNTGMRFHARVQENIRDYIARRGCLEITSILPGDYDADGAPDADDAAVLEACLNQGFYSAGCEETFDLNDDGVVDGCDLLILNVLVASAPAAVPLGCGPNPADSISILSGTPTVGGGMFLGLDNPLNTQYTGALTFVALTRSPDPHYPNGTLLPGYGMAGPGALGELLVDLGSLLALYPGQAWSQPRTPAGVPIGIPSNPNLVGNSLYAQGLLFDPTGAYGVTYALTGAYELKIGP